MLTRWSQCLYTILETWSLVRKPGSKMRMLKFTILHNLRVLPFKIYLDLLQHILQLEKPFHQRRWSWRNSIGSMYPLSFIHLWVRIILTSVITRSRRGIRISLRSRTRMSIWIRRLPRFSKAAMPFQYLKVSPTIFLK